MKEFDDMMEKKDIILVFAKNVNCRACEEDRWWTSKIPYNFLLVPNVGRPMRPMSASSTSLRPRTERFRSSTRSLT